MKRTLIVLTLVATPFLCAAENPPQTVPDSGGTAGMLVVGALLAFVLRRKASK